jgi:hypothetical protein
MHEQAASSTSAAGFARDNSNAAAQLHFHMHLHATDAHDVSRSAAGGTVLCDIYPAACIKPPGLLYSCSQQQQQQQLLHQELHQEPLAWVNDDATAEVDTTVTTGCSATPDLPPLAPLGNDNMQPEASCSNLQQLQQQQLQQRKRHQPRRSLLRAMLVTGAATAAVLAGACGAVLLLSPRVQQVEARCSMVRRQSRRLYFQCVTASVNVCAAKPQQAVIL